MKATTLLTAAVLVAGSAIPASALFASGNGSTELTGAAAPTAQDTATETFESVVASYDKAQAKFKEDIAAADKKERKAIRANHPINEYWPRFEAMGQAGEGRALLWLAKNIRTNRAIKSKDRAAALKPLYTALAANHVNADWFEGALESLAGQSRVLGIDDTRALLGSMLEKAESDKGKAGVMFYHAQVLEKEAPEEAAALMAEILEKYSGTKYAMHARAANAKPEDSVVGKIAPNFMAESIDGFEFSLEDYRGKVTVLDFYGFW